MNNIQTPVSGNESAAKAWLRAIEATASISENRYRILQHEIEDLAAVRGDAPALLSDRECLSYTELSQRSNRYARWALSEGLAQGETVCLLMPNRPEYLAIWLGITRVGGVVALLNTNLSGPSLAHSIDIVTPKHIIAAAELVDGLVSALPDLESKPAIWAHGYLANSFRRIDVDVERHSGERLRQSERRPVSIEDRALYIYTSGTTGLPKAANISHARILQWSRWFAGMMNAGPSDRLYDCLPMYHSVGGVVATGSMLVSGGSIVTRDKFSASAFWKDVIRWDCTLIQYIGELCRYLLHTPPSPQDTTHRVRMACGNGLARDVWGDFKTRFQIPKIFEFYAATEGGVSLFNVEGEPGAIGRVPSWLAHRFSPALVRFDFAKEEPIRNGHGFCIRCAPVEVGEAIGQVLDDPANVGSRFEGYTMADATEKRILRGVFKPGDVWVRTGDLMRRDKRGYYYFVDRVGDTFRWKGENVATSEVSGVICSFPGVEQASVYGVAVPGAEGRAGMAALLSGRRLDLSELRHHLASRLPAYARPLFLRIRSDMEMTGTFKHTKANLMRHGYNPSAITDPLYFDHPEQEAFVPLDEELYQRIQEGRIRL